MRKLFFVITNILLITTNLVFADDTLKRLQKLETDIEVMKQHLKTKKLTVRDSIILKPLGKFYVDDGVDTYFSETADNQWTFYVGGSAQFAMYTTSNYTFSDFNPDGAGTYSSGNASDYWNDISYKTLTDRGCLGSFDSGVELQDGRIVSDIEAILAIKNHPTKKTIYGMPMLDYKTFPKVSYKKADENGKLLPRDLNDEPIGGDDGIEMTSMFSIMLGAIKELNNRIEALEK